MRGYHADLTLLGTPAKLRADTVTIHHGIERSARPFLATDPETLRLDEP